MAKNIAPICMTGMLHKFTYLKHISLVLISVVLLQACNAMSVREFLAKPMQLDLTPPPGPPEYQAAYVDGCTTGISENNFNLIAQTTMGMYKNPVFNQQSPIYRSMWRSAYIYCALYVPYTYRNNPSFFKPSFRMQVKALPFTKRSNLIRSAPPGPPAFRIGWRQGCNTGKAATGKSKHRIPYKFVKDASFIEGDSFNPEFEKGWETAFWMCQRYYDALENPSRGLL